MNTWRKVKRTRGGETLTCVIRIWRIVFVHNKLESTVCIIVSRLIIGRYDRINNGLNSKICTY